MAKFAYKGIPIRDAQGNVVAVQPVRGIVAPDGLTYPGELSRDAEGQAFTYNQVPGSEGVEAVAVYTAPSAPGALVLDELGRAILVWR